MSYPNAPIMAQGRPSQHKTIQYKTKNHGPVTLLPLQFDDQDRVVNWREYNIVFDLAIDKSEMDMALIPLEEAIERRRQEERPKQEALEAFDHETVKKHASASKDLLHMIHATLPLEEHLSFEEAKNPRDPRELLAILKKKHGAQKGLHTHHLRRMLSSVEVKPGKATVTINTMRDLNQQLHAAGADKVPDDQLYSSFTTAIYKSGDKDLKQTVDFYELQGDEHTFADLAELIQLKEKERAMLKQLSNFSIHDMQTAPALYAKPSRPTCHHCGKHGHQMRDC